MVFDQPSTQDDHPCLFRKHRLAVQFANIWKETQIYDKTTHAKTDTIALFFNVMLISHPPLCPKPSRGS